MIYHVTCSFHTQVLFTGLYEMVHVPPLFGVGVAYHSLMSLLRRILSIVYSEYLQILLMDDKFNSRKALNSISVGALPRNQTHSAPQTHSLTGPRKVETKEYGTQTDM